MTKNRLIKPLLGAASILGVAACISVPASADHDSYRQTVDVPSHWSDGVASHQQDAWQRPVRVWINVESGNYRPGKGKGKARGKYKQRRSIYRETPFERLVLDDLSRRLPNGVVLVDSPRRADLRLNIRERDYDYSLNTVNVEYRNKKYKKKYGREGYGPCGRLDRALFERVTDQGRADFAYGMRIDGRFGYERRQIVSGREYENVRYGRNLRASTPCGVKEVSTYPNSTVRRYFETAQSNYPRQLRREVRGEVAERVARAAAREIYQFVPSFRARLAEYREHRYGDRYDRYDDRYDDRYSDSYDYEWRDPDYRDRRDRG